MRWLSIGVRGVIDLYTTYTPEQLEEMTIAFLAEYDDYYKNSKRNKKQTEEYCYDTVIQSERKRRVERVFSNLTAKDTLNCLKYGVEKSALPQFD